MQHIDNHNYAEEMNDENSRGMPEISPIEIRPSTAMIKLNE